MLNKIKHKIKNWVYKIIPPPPSRETFSQAGEDICIDFLFRDKKITQISYLELGVCHPTEGSNTYLFYKKGYQGILVEADKSQIEKIKLLRNRDVILNCGVGFEDKNEADFYIFEVSAHNTFSKEEAEFRINNGSYKLIKTEKIPLISINKIIKENFSSIPTLLSIDIEGLDLKVIQSLDLEKYPIPVICAETCQYSENHIRPKDYSIQNYLTNKGYFVYADTYINTIFVNYQWFHNK